MASYFDCHYIDSRCWLWSQVNTKWLLQDLLRAGIADNCSPLNKLCTVALIVIVIDVYKRNERSLARRQSRKAALPLRTCCDARAGIAEWPECQRARVVRFVCACRNRSGVADSSTWRLFAHCRCLPHARSSFTDCRERLLRNYICIRSLFTVY